MEETKKAVPYSCESYGHVLSASGECVHCGFNPYVDAKDDEELGGRFGEDEIF